MSPIFVVGIFTHAQSARPNYRLGEGLGSSIKMAEFRAAEDALRRIYLEKGSKGVAIPSDSLVSGQWSLEVGHQSIGDDEVLLQSSGKSGRLAAEFEKEPWSERDRVKGLLSD